MPNFISSRLTILFVGKKYSTVVANFYSYLNQYNKQFFKEIHLLNIHKLEAERWSFCLKIKAFTFQLTLIKL